jgi:hypothetical protein
MKRLLLITATFALLALSSGSGVASPPPAASQTPIPGTSSYTLVAWSELGMHCMDGKDFRVFSVLPPYNTIHAQLFKKGEPPVAITSGVTVTYQATTDTQGSVNSNSSKKTNFWSWAGKLFLASPPPDMGLAGYGTQGKAPQAMTFNTTENYWEAVGIPTMNYDDKGVFNPLPMAIIVARDSNNAVLATAKIVLPVSDELSCQNCHASGSDPAAEPAQGWVNYPDPARDMKANILRKHDDRFDIRPYLGQLKTNGWTYKSTLLSTAVSGTPVLCAACHSDNALALPGLPGIGAEASDMHLLHGPVNNPATGLPLDQNPDDLNSCYLCHPGPTTQCKRGAMNKVDCQSCHGTVSHVGDATRNPWLIEPSCQMCHNNSQRYTTTFDSNGLWRQTTDQTFATNSNVPIPGSDLYRYSSGHGSVFCSGCHGSPHAEFPSLKANDNVEPIALQKYAARITECAVCHTSSLTATANGGPHGIHIIGQAWVNAHPDYVDGHGHQTCAYCHGSDYRGLPLSVAKVARTFTGEGGNRTFPAGHQFNCYDCHNGPNGGG